MTQFTHHEVVSIKETTAASIHTAPNYYGKIYRQSFERGVPQGDLEITGDTDLVGTTISFLPDLDIFEDLDWSRDTLAQRLRETAFLTRGMRISLTKWRKSRS